MVSKFKSGYSLRIGTNQSNAVAFLMYIDIIDNIQVLVFEKEHSQTLSFRTIRNSKGKCE